MSLLCRLVLRQVQPEVTARLTPATFLTKTDSPQVDQTRGKKSLGGGSTKNYSGFLRGKKRGFKVYDGQRIQIGHRVMTQLKLWTLPGWNVDFKGYQNDLVALCSGRAMITVEKCNPKYDHGLDRVETHFPKHVRQKNFFRTHVHVIPDEQHQYFRLTEQI